MHIEVNTNGKPEVNQGQIVAIADQPPNANVCLDPSFDNLPFTGGELFSVKAKAKSLGASFLRNPYTDKLPRK
ncbi:MAG: hypothetical protein ACREPR_21520 [Brasilonema sp.]